MLDLITNVGQGKLTVSPDLIYHCSNFHIGGNGGVETYLGSLLENRPPNVSNYVIQSLQHLDQTQFKLLHIHSPDLLLQLTGECPAIFTVHNHSLYCPSGTKYLSSQQTVCQHNFSYLGCLWGKLSAQCGTRRPGRVIGEFQHTQGVLKICRQLKVTFIANSHYVRTQLINHGVPPDRTVTLHCGISLPKTATNPLSLEVHKNQRILFVGRIVPDKGLEWLLKTLVHTQPQIHLDIAGEGWDRPRLEKLANSLGLTQRITWHGWCQTDKLNRLYQECLAVIFPSIWPEPAGLVTLEAYAHYRPVIASAVGGIPEYLQEQETGILVEANDVHKLAAAIDELATNYPKGYNMGTRGHALLLDKFTIDAHKQNLQEIYEQTIVDFPKEFYSYIRASK
jgi:glycosyltransferase involved in cell wall biosynthesis